MLAATQSVVPPGLRGTAASLLVMIATVFGLGLGPLIVGIISDHLPWLAPDARVRTALSFGTIFSAITGIVFLFATRSVRRAAVTAGIGAEALA
jgi:MFS family permease